MIIFDTTATDKVVIEVNAERDVSSCTRLANKPHRKESSQYLRLGSFETSFRK